MIVTERVQRFWQCAAQFPADKEAVYPEHAEAQEFDRHLGKTVLEYGCGGGSDVLSFMRRGCHVLAVDVVPQNLAATRDRASRLIAEAEMADGIIWPPLVGRLEDSAPIELPDASFDVVSSHGVLHHIPDPRPVIEEFYRLLKSGGECYVMLYTEQLYAEHEARAAELVRWRGLSVEEAFGWCTDGEGCPYAVAYAEVGGRRLLEEAGFEVTRVFPYFEGRFRTFRGQK
jgi:SAM-dependent methyltransferase